jgi:hypothetical protein
MKANQDHTPSDDAEALRLRAIDKLFAFKRENASQTDDASQADRGGYGRGWWADRGFNVALGILNDILPQPGEGGTDYLRRVIALVRAQMEAYQTDQDDPDGSSHGALDAAMWAIIDALPQRSRSEASLRDPLPHAEWEVWYRDTFDRESPPQRDVSGRGLVKGLIELWARYLFETIRPGGRTGFSRFHMRWEGRYVDIEGERGGATRLREWAFGKKEHTTAGYVREGDTRLLEQIAVVHAHLILANESSEPILETAILASDRYDFETRLLALTER